MTRTQEHRWQGKNWKDWKTFALKVNIRAENSEVAKKIIEHGFDSTMLFEDKVVFQPKIEEIGLEIERIQDWYVTKNLVTPRTSQEEAEHVVEEANEVLEAVNMIASTEFGKLQKSCMIAEEIADVIITACALANCCGIDVASAIEIKTKKNLREGILMNLTLAEIEK